jgi:hypothetical protein
MAETRRAYRRVPVKFKVNVLWKTRSGKQRQVQAQAENVSGTGMFMTVPIRLRRETPICFTVILPPEITQIPVELVCRGRVIRANRAGEPTGFGAIIDDYELRPVPPAA